VRYNLEYTEENQGRFQVVEEVPDGYVGGWTQEFVVDQPGTETILFQVANQRGKGQIKVTKTDKETKELLSGTVFQIIADENICTPGGQLIYEKGEVADTITTENGVAVSKKLDYGTYRIKEIQPTTGYLLGEETKQVTLSWKDADTSLITEELTFEDEKNRIVLHKTGKKAEDDQESISLSGAVFLCWKQGQEEEPVRIVTDNDGKAILTGLSPGTYCYQEIQAPSGYVTDSDVKQFTINANGRCEEEENGVIEVENDFIKLEISKTDSLSGELISGAHLRLTDSDGNVIREWVSSSQPLRFNCIAAGIYFLEETSAPVGYSKADTIRFEVQETDTVQTICMEDYPLTEITLAKKIMADEITWAHGTPTFILTIKGSDLWGQDHEYRVLLSFNAEYVKNHTEEDGSVILEKTIQGIPAGSAYEVSELKVNRYGLIEVTGTENVTIQNLASPEYGRDPEELFHVTVDLSKKTKGTRILFENRKYRYDDYSHNDTVINEIPIANKSDDS
ncbi:MAG: SpaA isopeptide-forming pilin-related protein, partial [Lachnospiraceae bacterium]|nr:SpaA isopeptide-forming pilin-related protein [Lachnospiraceae bacterium]